MRTVADEWIFGYLDDRSMDAILLEDSVKILIGVTDVIFDNNQDSFFHLSFIHNNNNSHRSSGKTKVMY